MATIKEIADLAGVSRGTVDRVINKRGAVNPETAEKINEIIRMLNYRPNRAGIVLAAQKKKMKIGVILFGLGNPFFDDVVFGIQQKTEEFANYNCTVLLRRVSSNVEDQLTAIDEFIGQEINGLAISPFNDPRVIDKINTLYDLSIPVVTLNTDVEHSKRIAYVGSNYLNSGETAAGLMRLMTSGAVKVGIVSGSKQVLCHAERISGFSKCIAKHYPNLQIVDTVYTNDDEFESYEKTQSLLTNHPEINALFFSAGGVYGGCRAVINAGRSKDLCIITFDSIETTKDLLEKKIICATICQQPMEQGSKPLDILFSYLMTGELPKKEFNYVQADIRIRENIH